MSGAGDLVARARERAAGTAVPDHWGELLEVDEGDAVVVRFRGRDVDDRYEPAREVVLVWDESKERRYLRGYFRLMAELDRAKPAIGDTLAIYRGPDYETKAGNTGYGFGVETEPDPAPLPDEVGRAEDDNELPFLCPDASVSQSAPSAVAATG